MNPAHPLQSNRRGRALTCNDRSWIHKHLWVKFSIRHIMDPGSFSWLAGGSQGISPCPNRDQRDVCQRNKTPLLLIVR